jgi:hypothetical protein
VAFRPINPKPARLAPHKTSLAPPKFELLAGARKIAAAASFEKLHTTTMGATKRKADASSAPAKKDKGASGDRSAKRPRKSDGAAESPAKSKPEKTERAAPKASVFKEEETSFPRGGASVLTPLEHKQIQIKANQDVLFEQTGGKRMRARPLRPQRSGLRRRARSHTATKRRKTS